MTNPDNIAALLHQTQSNRDTDHLCDLAQAINGASPNECKLALINFTVALLSASRQVVLMQKHGESLQ